MAEICIVSTCNILATTSTNDHPKIDLTPWDLQFLMLGPIQKALIFLKSPIQHHHQHQKDLINHLKMSLSKTLDFFPLLAGRLITVKNDNNTISFFITCNNAGVQFTHATVNLKVSDILEPVYVPQIVGSLFPYDGHEPNLEGNSKPLLAVQVTELVDGFIIGCTMNHVVADGTSYWHFMNSWSEISRGFNNISKSPLLQKWFPNDVNCPLPITIPSELIITMDRYVPPPLKERVFHFPKENIKKLKEKANIEMGTNEISSLQALLAHLWLSVTRCRRNDSVQETSLKLNVGARPRLHPSLPTEYFGNAVQSSVVILSAGELLKHGLGWVACGINEVVALQTHEEVTKFYTSWMQNPKFPQIGVFVSNSLLTTSSSRFNVYGNDFGWGKPAAVRNGGDKFDGKITVVAGAEEGSIDIEVCLVPETLYALADDTEFLEAVKLCNK